MRHQSGDEVSDDGVENRKKSASQLNPTLNAGDTTMIKTALTAALVIGSMSVALASEFDANLGNRYPQATQSFQTSNVALTGSVANSEKAWFDRASRSFGGGY